MRSNCSPRVFRLPVPNRRSRMRNLRLEELEHVVAPAVWMVTSEADDGAGSLRWAILNADFDSDAQSSINFNIPGPSTQVHDIFLHSPLPDLTRSGLVIDGHTQPGASAYTTRIQIDGASAGADTNGLTILQPFGGAGITIQGLSITRFSGWGIDVIGYGNLINDNRIGTDAAGTVALGNGKGGIGLQSGYGYNAITRNTISGNKGPGVYISGATSISGDTIYYSDSNVLMHNMIGMSIDGEQPLGNAGVGIFLDNYVRNNRIGSNSDDPFAFAEGNIISANAYQGIYMQGSSTSNNIVTGNQIGIDYNGGTAVPNGNNGIWLAQGTHDNRIGVRDDQYSSYERNFIAGNTYSGIVLTDSGTNSNVIAGNYIGLGYYGGAVGNLGDGIAIFDGPKNNRIGTNGNGSYDDYEGNTISANGAYGVAIAGSGANQNIVAGNRIGTNDSGTPAFKNGWSGVGIWNGAQGNIIGTRGTSANPAGERNIISGNSDRGVLIFGSGTDQNVVAGNYIGIDSSGTKALGNTAEGVAIFDGAQGNRVGTNGDGLGDVNERNVVSANGRNGIAVAGSGANQNIVSGNYVGTNASGAAALPNAYSGLGLWGGAQGNRIGVNGSDANAAAEGNLISGNASAGAFFVDQNTSSNSLAGNRIGTNAAGTLPLPNSADGVYIGNGASGNRIGTNGDNVGDALERNIISGNGANGINITGSGTTVNVIAGNYIGTDVTGIAKVPNTFSGIAIWGQATNNRIGTAGVAADTVGERNIVSGNGDRGIWISGFGTNQNVVAGNYVGVDASGNGALGNAAEGVTMFDGAQGNRVGTNGDGVGDISERNIVSANGRNGIAIAGLSANQNVVAGNYVGTNSEGALALPNAYSGVAIWNSAVANRVGVNGGDTNAAGEANLISGNSANGVLLADPGTSFNIVAGNLIGTNGAATQALANGSSGVDIVGAASRNRIGTNSDGAGDVLERNIISGNAFNGVSISDPGTSLNVVAGNFIGTNPTGTGALANGFSGVGVWNGAANNRIGIDGSDGNAATEANLISGNSGHGIYLFGAGTIANAAAGNLIGTTASGNAALANSGNGVYIVGGSAGNRVGTNGDGVGDTLERNTISGNAQNGITIEGSGTNLNAVAGNFIGVSSSGSATLPNGWSGIVIQAAAQGNRIGTNGDGVGDSAERNVISGNSQSGIIITGSGSNLNIVAGNYIGTDINGSAKLPNALGGVSIRSKAQGNVIGTNGDGAGDLAERNVISGNSQNGVAIADLGTDQNVIAGNYIGTSAAGSAALGNSWWGITVYGGAANTRIGTNSDGVGDTAERNVVSGNVQVGIGIDGMTTTGSKIAGNFVGLNATGNAAIGNGYQGVYVNGPGTIVGGAVAAARNIISGNGNNGVWINGALGTMLQGNYIGTDLAGNLKLGNLQNGVLISGGATNSVVGGNSGGVGNVISGNGLDGVSISGSGTNLNVISGNYIGTNAGGILAIGNSGNGVGIYSAAKFIRIGTDADGGGDAAERNLISGNLSSGVRIDGVGTDSNVVAGNFVGTDVSGKLDIGNAVHGILITYSASNNTIGGTSITSANLISGNDNYGVRIRDQVGDTVALTGNEVLNNWIGIDSTGAKALPNSSGGISLLSVSAGGVTNNVLGSPGNGNIVSGNGGIGLELSGAATSGNFVQANSIGTDSAGTLDLGNANDGVSIDAGAHDNAIGGDTTAAGNVIAFNHGNGIAVKDAGTIGNSIRHNSMFVNSGVGIALTGGGNEQQNHPDLLIAQAGTKTIVLGTLNSTPNSSFRVRLYAVAAADSPGLEEGAVELGDVPVSTDNSGYAWFKADALGGTTVGDRITAIAEDVVGNSSQFSAAVTAQFDADGPSVTINQGARQPDPSNGATITFDVHFSEPAFGFDSSDIDLSSCTVGGNLVATVTGGWTDYTVTVTGMNGAGFVIASIPAVAAEDFAGNPSHASTSTDNSVYFDNLPVTVSINQAAGQLDPTSTGPILFDVVFSQPVIGFTGSDIDFSGSTVGGNLAASVSGSGTNYSVAVTGMSGYGAVVASVPAGAVANAVGTLNVSSNSTDNTVVYNGVGTVGFTTAVLNTAEGSTVVVTVNRSGKGDGALSVDFTVTDGTATAGSDYIDLSDGHTLAWAPNETGDKSFKFAIIDDNVSEGKESINLALSNLVGFDHPALVNSQIVIAPSDPVAPGSYTDQDSDAVTVKLKGAGSADVYLTNGHGPIQSIDLVGTDPKKSALNIAVKTPKGGAGDGRVSVGAITGSGLKSFSAPMVDLNGDGIELNGYLGSVTLGNILDGADIISTGGISTQLTNLKLADVADGTSIKLDNGISSLTAKSFGRGQIATASIGALFVKGDFSADIDVSGSGVKRGKPAVRSLAIGGVADGIDIRIAGNVGLVSFGSFRNSHFYAGYTGADDGSGVFSAAAVNSFKVTGAIDGFQNSHVIASSFKSVSLQSVDATNSTWFGFIANDQITTLKVGSPPSFTYRPGDGAFKSVGDFEVRIV